MRRRLATYALAVVLVIGGVLFGPGLYRDTRRGDEVARLTRMMQLRPGMSVAEVGAGEGRMLIPLAQRLGPGTKVFATDIDADALDKLRGAVARATLANVVVIEGGEHETKLPGDCCDAIVMADVYHHLTDPPSMTVSLFKSLKPGGRLAVIDFAPTPWLLWLRRPSGVPKDRGGHGIPSRIVTEELGRAGFLIDRVMDDWWRFVPRRYCVLARKPPS
jgi:ubiquinone/menaquinone biosynthesis C-methylase UbiE